MKSTMFNSIFSGRTGLLHKLILGAFLLAAFVVPALSQDDEAVPGKVLDANNRAIGKAELIPHSGDVQIRFDYNIKLLLDGGSRLVYIRPESGSRSSTINCNYREYKVDPKNPKDSSRWDETGSGTATLKIPGSGDVTKITASVTQTTKVVGDNEVAVTGKAVSLTIVLD